MNDLTALCEHWEQPEPPSSAALSAARAALLQQAAAARAPVGGSARLTAAEREQPSSRGLRAGRLRQRGTGWRAAGIGLTATAAATAVAAVVVTAPTVARIATDGGGHGSAHPVVVSQLSGRQILLAAATTAAAAPPHTGTYWLVKTADGPGPAAKNTLATWYTHDGTPYSLAPDGKAVYRNGEADGFSVGVSSLTARQVQYLPTDPAALKAWITRTFSHPSRQPPVPGTLRPTIGTYPRSEIPDIVESSLEDLLYLVPAPPAVRAAAFRAMASMPQVTKLGRAGGGVVELRVSVPKPAAAKFPSGRVPAGAGEITLIIDSSDLTLRGFSDYQDTMTILAARWTNSRPKVAPVSRLFPPKRHLPPKIHLHR